MRDTRTPWWLLVASALWALLAVAPHLPPPVSLRDDSAIMPLVWLTLRGSETVVFVWAASRRPLGPRLRQALALFALTAAIGVLLTASGSLPLVGLEPLLSDGVYRAGVVVTYATGLAAVLRMPAVPFGNRWREFLLDVAASVVGVGVISVVATSPLIVNGVVQRAAVVSLLPQVMTVASLNAFVLRGVARPSRRAFWLIAASTAGNLVVTTLYAFPGGAAPGISAAVLTSLTSLWAMHAMHDDALTGADQPSPLWLRAFNPLPPLVTIGVGALLVRESRGPASPYIGLLAATMMALVVLLMLRHVVTAAENLRLVARQAERDRMAEAARVDAIATLTGGIAHWYNNLLTVVLGHADLGEDAARGHDDGRVAESLGSIRLAAERAADLTRQLMAYAGRQARRRDRVSLGACLAAVTAEQRAMLPPTVSLVYHASPDAIDVRGDREQIAMAVEELVANARHAMHDHGAIHLRLRTAVTTADDGVAAPVAGRWAVIEVSDSGPGATPEVLAAMFDPFFTTQGMAAAAGLGLSAVRGIATAHGGRVHARGGDGGGLTSPSSCLSRTRCEPAQPRSSVPGKTRRQTPLGLRAPRPPPPTPPRSDRTGRRDRW